MSPTARTRTVVLAAVAVVALTLVAYAPVVRCGFIWDDNDYVTKNALLKDAHGLARIWTEPQALPQFYPLTFTTFWIEHQVWGLRPAGYHVVNVLLHAANAVLLGVLLQCLAVRGAWLAAAAFAAHPVAVESVAWITERKNVLSLLFYLLAGMAYLSFAGVLVPDHDEPRSSRRRWGAYVGALLLFACALLSKSVTASLPAAILLVLWWKRGRLRVMDVALLVPFFALGAVAGLHTAWIETHHVGAQGESWSLTPVERVLLAGRAAWFYAAKLAWPHPLIFVYPRWTIDARMAWQALYPAGVALVVLLLWAFRRRIGRGPLVAVLFFLGTLVPALGFFNVFPMQYSFVADHFQYHASVGLIALAAAGAALAAERLGRAGRIEGAWLGAVVLAACVVLAWRQLPAYRGLEPLWRDTLAKNPAAWMAHNNLGIILRDRDDLRGAIDHFEAALRLEPHNPAAHGNLGDALEGVGRTAEAVEHFREAVRIDPKLAIAHFGLGYTLDKLGRTSEAIEPYHEALRLRPNWVSALENLAWIRATAASPSDRDGEEAVRLGRRACELTSDRDVAALDTLAAAYAEAGRFDEAVVTARQALARARAGGDEARANAIAARLSLYESRRPFHPAELR